MHWRKLENLHILFWLIKDLCWIQDFKLAGTFMFFPTFTVALWLTFKSRHNRVDFLHNLAVSCWILANTTWMIGEFFFDDTTRPIATVFFVLGIIVLSFHYLPLIWRKSSDESQSVS